MKKLWREEEIFPTWLKDFKKNSTAPEYVKRIEGKQPQPNIVYLLFSQSTEQYVSPCEKKYDYWNWPKNASLSLHVICKPRQAPRAIRT